MPCAVCSRAWHARRVYRRVLVSLGQCGVQGGKPRETWSVVLAGKGPCSVLPFTSVPAGQRCRPLPPRHPRPRPSWHGQHRAKTLVCSSHGGTVVQGSSLHPSHVLFGFQEHRSICCVYSLGSCSVFAGDTSQPASYSGRPASWSACRLLGKGGRPPPTGPYFPS